jgi:hypothetical protein
MYIRHNVRLFSTILPHTLAPRFYKNRTLSNLVSLLPSHCHTNTDTPSGWADFVGSPSKESKYTHQHDMCWLCLVVMMYCLNDPSGLSPHRGFHSPLKCVENDAFLAWRAPWSSGLAEAKLSPYPPPCGIVRASGETSAACIVTLYTSTRCMIVTHYAKQHCE